jgi:hypothetical protein
MMMSARWFGGKTRRYADLAGSSPFPHAAGATLTDAVAACPGARTTTGSDSGTRFADSPICRRFWSSNETPGYPCSVQVLPDRFRKVMPLNSVPAAP